jgi:LacI family transcriptional regulator
MYQGRAAEAALESMSMRVTQKNIAKDLNVSSITVHRALNNSGYVSKKLRQRILDYAKRVNYVPHKASQVLVRNKVRKIAIFSSADPKYFWNDIRLGINIASQQILPFDYRVRYHMIPRGDSQPYFGKLKEEVEEGVEAIALVNQSFYDMKTLIAFVDSRSIPYITLNIDAPESRRLCHIGPDYFAGGKLAAEFIGKTLMFLKDARVLVINKKAEILAGSGAPDINRQRLEGFLSVMQKDFPDVRCETMFISPQARPELVGSDLEDILSSGKGRSDAIYLIPAFNKQFVSTIAKLGLAGKTVVIHDLDPWTNRYFRNKWISAVIYQNPILQGYYAVKILENLLESGQLPEEEHIPIVHSLILNENRDLFRNHFLFTKLNYEL